MLLCKGSQAWGRMRRPGRYRDQDGSEDRGDSKTRRCGDRGGSNTGKRREQWEERSLNHDGRGLQDGCSRCLLFTGLERRVHIPAHGH